MEGPSLVRFGRHALDRCQAYDRPPEAVADLLLAEHRHRAKNAGSADWRVTGEGLVVLYDWPDRDDATTADVVTLWPRR